MYRAFFFYYLVAVFICSLFFIQVHSYPTESLLHSNLHSQDSVRDKTTKNLEQNKPILQLVEVLDPNDTPDLSRNFFVGTRNSRGKNESLSANSSYQMAHLQKQRPLEESSMAGNFLEELEKSKQFIVHTSKNNSIDQESKILKDPHSHYFKGQSVKKLHLQMTQSGKLSVNAMEFEGAEYLIHVAQSIFRYWVDFIPANMIALGFIKTDNVGTMQSILVFSLKAQNDYRIYFLKPFNSNSLNQSTLEAFSYYRMPVHKTVKIKNIGVEFKIYKDTLSISANFEFHLVNS